MTKRLLDTLGVDPREYGVQGAAALGIRESGKSYTCTGIAEDASTHRVVIGGLNTMQVVTYPERGAVALSDWAVEILAQHGRALS